MLVLLLLLLIIVGVKGRRDSQVLFWIFQGLQSEEGSRASSPILVHMAVLW